MTPLSSTTQEILDSLQAAVTQELERKRRLGHYAVIWQDSRPVLIGDDAPSTEAGVGNKASQARHDSN